MNTYFSVELILGTAALVLSLCVYLFFRKNFLKIFQYAYASMWVLLFLAGVAVTFIYD
jgi:hypothetical protein